MPLDLQAVTVIERRDASIQPPLGPDASLADRRGRFNQTWRELGPEVGKVEDRPLPGPGGTYRSASIPLLAVALSPS